MNTLAPSPAEKVGDGTSSNVVTHNERVFAGIVRLEGYLDHLNSRYAYALGVTSRFQVPELARNLLEFARGHLLELRNILNAVRTGDIVERRKAEWQQAKATTDQRITGWLRQCSLSLRSGRPDDNMGIDARMIAMAAMSDCHIPLTSKS
jgi:hypothetical protein